MVRDDDLFDFLVEDVLDDFAETLELGFEFFAPFLLVFVLGQFQAFFGHRNQSLTVVFPQLLDDVFIDGFGHVNDFESALLNALHEGRVGNRVFALAGDVVDLLLILLHPADVVFERSHLVAAAGSVVAKNVRDLLSVRRIFVDSQLHILGELLVELLAHVLILHDFFEHFHAFLDEILADHLQDFVLLKGFSGDVEREIFGVDDALDEAEVFGDELLAVVHDEDAADVQLDVVLLLLVLEQVEGGAFGDEQEGLELELTLDGKVFDRKMVFPVVRQALVKVTIFLLGNVVGVSGPDWLRLVQLLVFDVFGLDFLGFLLRVFLLVVVVLDLFDLGLFLLALFLLFLLFFRLLVLHFLLLLLRHGQLDRIADELRVLLHHLLDLFLLDVFRHVLFEMEDDDSSPTETLWFFDGLDGEGTSGGGFPLVKIVVVVLRLDANAIGDQIRRVESHAELTDHRNVGASL